MALRGYIYTKEKKMPVSEADIKPYWRSDSNVKTGLQR